MFPYEAIADELSRIKGTNVPANKNCAVGANILY